MSISFDELGLGQSVLNAVSDSGYTEPTEIQAQAIPLVLTGQDMIGVAQTGTGKTASFTLPMIEKLSTGRARARMPRSLILEPTRELAAQVADNFDVYGKYSKLTKALLIGGVAFAEQEAKLTRGVDVLIATPGRLLDHLERGKILLADIKTFVIDEADRMLDMGFIPDVERIFKLLPKTRQTLMFSATMPAEIRRLSKTYLKDPLQVEVAPPATTSKNITQALVTIRGSHKEKRAALRDLIRGENVSNALIFCNRKRDVTIVANSLSRHGFDVASLHGDMAQSLRMETLGRFKNGDFKLMVASDVAARGLDIVNMSHVINYDVPSHAEDYVHRIGRTGRAGNTGHAFTLSTSEDRKYLAAIENLIGEKISRVNLDGTKADPEPANAEKNVAQKSHRSSSNSGKAQATANPRRADTARGRAKPDDSEQQSKETKAPRSRQRNDRPTEPARRQDKPTVDHPRKSDEGRNRRNAEKDTENVVGLGDHVPNFLRR